MDGLRAVAVIAVLLYHMKKDYLPGGFSGVDCFFVISGYVVTRSLDNHWKKVFNFKSSSSNTSSSNLSSNLSITNYLDFLLDFYSRRILRLYPSLLAVFFLNIAIILPFFVPYWVASSHWKPGLRLQTFWGNALFSLLGLANVRFADSAVDYW